jgi:hypothetical protein
MGTKHTPGPWEISAPSLKPDHVPTIGITSPGRWINLAGVYSAKKDEADANARLIAKAPIMLGILHGMIAELDAYEIDDDDGLAEPLRLARLVVAELDGDTPPPISGGAPESMGAECNECVRLRAINAEMLDALRHVLYWHDTDYIGGIDWRNVRNAIALAEADTPPPVSGGAPSDPMAFPEDATHEQVVEQLRRMWDHHVNGEGPG